jgi:hypothetical protein
MNPAIIEHHSSITAPIPVIHDDWQGEPTAKLLRLPRHLKRAEYSRGVQIERVKTIQEDFPVISWFPFLVFTLVLSGYAWMAWFAIAHLNEILYVILIKWH